jgi:hypothetical protein
LCSTPKQQFCSFQSSGTCLSTNWTFEPAANEIQWDEGDNGRTLSTMHPEMGSGSLQVSASSDGPPFGQIAVISVAPCTNLSTFEIGNMNSLAGHTISASIFVPQLTGDFSLTSCQLGYDTLALAPVVLAQVAPIVPGKYFTMTAVFPSNTPPSNRIFIQCAMPPSWPFADDATLPSTPMSWFVDDVSIK